MKKVNRIKKSDEIASIVKSHQRVYSDYFFIYYKEKENLTRVAISVSKKYGIAVERNHAKRVIRELMRHRIDSQTPLDLVFVVKPNFKEANYVELDAALQKCLNIINYKLKNKGDKNENN